tara:strand:+ start:193 stop:738 length:546 start_codon:yes stop_codon:yes gene_type:complete
MSIKVIDNFANIEEQLQIFNYINKTQNLLYLFQTSSYHPDIKNKFITPNTIDYPQIVHSIFMDDKILNVFLFSCVYNLLHKNKLSNYFIHRIKLNITFPYPNSEKTHGPIHTDLGKKGISIIYYVNNSDGDTVFFNEKLNLMKRVSPRQGRAVVFDSNIKHTACCPVNSTHRQIINFVLCK